MTGRWVDDDNASLVTDLYEITMAAAFHAAGAFETATFDLFVRSLPGPRRFLIAAGLDDALVFLERFRFAGASLDYLASLAMFAPDFLEYLAAMRFQGEVRAPAEGEIVFANEPLLSVTAPLPQAQLVETFLLNCIGFQTMIASKAARIAIATGPDRSFVDFSPRRDHGADAALKAARAAVIGGAAATSLALAGRLYGLEVSGTMAHSFVMRFEEEADAFRHFARTFPGDAVLLIDTYDTEEGARVAAAVATELAPEGITIRGVRIDSGDLARLSRSVRRILDDAGHAEVAVFASGDLDEHRIAGMVAAGCPVDAFGVGTRLGTSADAPYLGVVYKLVEAAGRPVMKLSSGKATLPGRKQVWRGEDHDVIGLAGEDLAGRPLLDEVMVGGTRARPAEPIGTMAARRAAGVAALPERLRTLTGTEEPWPVRVSPDLAALRDRLTTELE